MRLFVCNLIYVVDQMNSIRTDKFQCNRIFWKFDAIKCSVNAKHCSTHKISKVAINLIFFGGFLYTFHFEMYKTGGSLYILMKLFIKIFILT